MSLTPLQWFYNTPLFLQKSRTPRFFLCLYVHGQYGQWEWKMGYARSRSKFWRRVQLFGIRGSKYDEIGMLVCLFPHPRTPCESHKILLSYVVWRVQMGGVEKHSSNFHLKTWYSWFWQKQRHQPHRRTKAAHLFLPGFRMLFPILQMEQIFAFRIFECAGLLCRRCVSLLPGLFSPLGCSKAKRERKKKRKRHKQKSNNQVLATSIRRKSSQMTKNLS